MYSIFCFLKNWEYKNVFFGNEDEITSLMFVSVEIRRRLESFRNGQELQNKLKKHKSIHQSNVQIL